MDGLLPARPQPLNGTQYTTKLIRYLNTNKARLAQPPYAYTGPSSNQVGNMWQQTYTIATLGLDPNSSLLNPTLTTLFSLGLAGSPASASADSSSSAAKARAPSKAATPSANQNIKPLTLRLPADRLLYLLLLFQSSQTKSISANPNIGPTDIPVPSGAQILANPSNNRAGSTNGETKEGDVQSVRSWAGSVRTVGGLFGSSSGNATTSSRTRQTSSSSWTSFFGSSSPRRPAPNSADEAENRTRIIWATLSILPSLTIHCLPPGESLLLDLVNEGTYNVMGGLEVKVPLNVFRGLWALELDGYDPRGVYIPIMPGLKSLSVKGVRDGEDWVEELLALTVEEAGTIATPSSSGELSTDSNTDDPITPPSQPRFPSLQYLSLTSAQLFAFPSIPCASLAHLDISSNLLNAIPSSLSSLPHLQSLNLSNNMIESVRGAHLVIPHVAALNLRNNRIDCLSGLEGIVPLQRIDVRKNRLTEIEEVGRLAVLPHVREIYVGAGNTFQQEEEEDWRGRLFLAFAEEGRGDGGTSTRNGAAADGKDWPLVDGYAASWGEKRFVQGEMAKRGRARASRREHGHGRADTSAEGRASNVLVPQTPRAPIRDPFVSLSEASQQTVAARNGPVRAVSPNPGVDQGKRRRQRIVELDGSSGIGSDTASEGAVDKGKHRVLPETMASVEDAIGSQVVGENANGSSGNIVSSHTRSRTEHGGSTQGTPRHSRRDRIAASTYEEPASGTTTPGPSADDMRAKMEALKEEVGDSWLKVLASQSRVDIAKSPVAKQPNVGDGDDAGGSDVVKVVMKKGKKKRAVGEIK